MKYTFLPSLLICCLVTGQLFGDTKAFEQAVSQYCKGGKTAALAQKVLATTQGWKEKDRTAANTFTSGYPCVKKSLGAFLAELRNLATVPVPAPLPAPAAIPVAPAVPAIPAAPYVRPIPAAPAVPTLPQAHYERPIPAAPAVPTLLEKDVRDWINKLNAVNVTSETIEAAQIWREAKFGELTEQQTIQLDKATDNAIMRKIKKNVNHYTTSLQDISKLLPDFHNLASETVTNITTKLATIEDFIDDTSKTSAEFAAAVLDLKKLLIEVKAQLEKAN